MAQRQVLSKPSSCERRARPHPRARSSFALSLALAFRNPAPSRRKPQYAKLAARTHCAPRSLSRSSPADGRHRAWPSRLCRRRSTSVRHNSRAEVGAPLSAHFRYRHDCGHDADYCGARSAFFFRRPSLRLAQPQPGPRLRSAQSVFWDFCVLRRGLRERPLHRPPSLDPKLNLFLCLCLIPILGILLHDRTRLIIFLLTFFHYGLTFSLELLPSHSRKSQRSHGQRKNHGQTETCSTLCFSLSRAIPNPFGSALVPASSESLPHCRS